MRADRRLIVGSRRPQPLVMGPTIDAPPRGGMQPHRLVDDERGLLDGQSDVQAPPARVGVDVGELAAPADDVGTDEVDTAGEREATGARERPAGRAVLNSRELERSPSQLRIDGGARSDLASCPAFACLNLKAISFIVKNDCVCDPATIDEVHALSKSGS